MIEWPRGPAQLCMNDWRVKKWLSYFFPQHFFWGHPPLSHSFSDQALILWASSLDCLSERPHLSPEPSLFRCFMHSSSLHSTLAVCSQHYQHASRTASNLLCNSCLRFRIESRWERYPDTLWVAVPSYEAFSNPALRSVIAGRKNSPWHAISGLKFHCPTAATKPNFSRPNPTSDFATLTMCRDQGEASLAHIGRGSSRKTVAAQAVL